jgi:hypothetical protein
MKGRDGNHAVMISTASIPSNSMPERDTQIANRSLRRFIANITITVANVNARTMTGNNKELLSFHVARLENITLIILRRQDANVQRD